MIEHLIIPHWPAPNNVRALSTTRLGGVSSAPWNSLNLGSHVGDSSSDVASNRLLLASAAGLPCTPYWLNQTHSTQVVEVDARETILPNADASYSRQSKQVCVVMTADCLPVLFCHRDGRQVAAAHAGWRGLCDGILENTLSTFNCAAHEVVAWIGPAIGAKVFEVGSEVRAAFIAHHPEATTCFTPIGNKYLADLVAIASLRLQRAGVTSISYSRCCTYSEPDRFFSYRRDGQTGRQASLIWIEADAE